MCIYLPRHHEAPEIDTSARAAPVPERGSGQRVLVVDDEPTVRVLVADVLEAAGYTGIEATDGSGAVSPHLAVGGTPDPSQSSYMVAWGCRSC